MFLSPSPADIAHQREYVIYENGLKECIKLLRPALSNLRINPKDPTALKQVKQLAIHFARYLKPTADARLRDAQHKILHPLEERISAIAHPQIKQALRGLFPVLFQGEKSVKAQAERQLAQARQSQIMQAFPETKTKRSLQESEAFPALFDLATLNGANGFAVNGLASNNFLGDSVRGAGDINGDGVQDLVIGAQGVTPGGLTDQGSVYVLFGKPSGWPASFDLTTLNGLNGFTVVENSGTALNFLGVSVSGAGDINGDGVQDLVMGAYGASPDGYTSQGAVYVLFGQPSGWFSTFPLTSLNGTNGFLVHVPLTSEELGFSVSGAGDLNGDGVSDLVMGAPFASSSGTYSGSAYTLFGKASGWSSTFDLTTLDGTNGFVMNGLASNDNLGISVSGAGDINGDGVKDFIVGAQNASPGGLTYAGSAYVVFGKSSGWSSTFDLTTLNGANGFVVNGLAVNDQLGSSISGAGDINGDGVQDLVIGAQGISTAYILFGKASGWPASFDLTTLIGTNGFKVNGLAGCSVSGIGDINGDGVQDFVLGAASASPGGQTDSGSAYVVYGQASGWPSSFDLTTLNGANGFMLNGLRPNDQLGYFVSGAGDINGDGTPDLVLGANSASPGGLVSAGSAYVLFGITTPAPTKAPTTAPTLSPTISPTIAPISSPSVLPTIAPISSPSVIAPTPPTESPTTEPTSAPSGASGENMGIVVSLGIPIIVVALMNK